MLKLLTTGKCAYLADVFVPGNDLAYNFFKVLLKNKLFKTFFLIFIIFLYPLLYIIQLNQNSFIDLGFYLTNKTDYILMSSDKVQ